VPLLVSEVEAGAGKGASREESPDRIAVVSAGSGAAEADPADAARPRVRRAMRIERLPVMATSHDVPVGAR
jgi:hypothetical protein